MDGHFLLLVKATAVLIKLTCFSQTLQFCTKTRILAQIRSAPQQIDHDCSYGNHIQNLDTQNTLLLSQVAICYSQWFKAGTTRIHHEKWTQKHKITRFPNHGNLGA